MALSDHTLATDRELLGELGRRLRAAREQQGLTVVDAAAQAGLSRRTVWRAEQGHNPTLATVVRLVRLYGRLADFEAFLREPEVSPMALIRRERGRQERPRG
jgi:transcriptional regulator with XRE-family HTH domain